MVPVHLTLFIDTPFNRVSASLFSALSITAIEVLFHLYVKKHVLKNLGKSYIPAVNRNDRFATEFSEEMNDMNKSPKTDDE